VQRAGNHDHPARLAVTMALAVASATGCGSSSEEASNAGPPPGSSGSAAGVGNGGATGSGGMLPSGSGGTNGGGPSGGAVSTGTGGSVTTGGSGGAISGSGGSSAGAAGAGTGGTSGGSAGSSGAPAGNGGNGGSGMGGQAGSGGGSSVVFPPGCKCMDMGPPSCTPTGHVTYTLAKAPSPTQAQQTAYDAITCAMEGAVAYYNCNTTITKQLNVSYVPTVNTADGNINGSIRFGNMSDMQCVTAMHEVAHTVGVGQASNWGSFNMNGTFTGMNATAELRAITGNATDVLHCDSQHFWPYGLNYVTEAHSTADLVDHCRMVTAIRKDLGLK
jgi:hypothetical protein